MKSFRHFFNCRGLTTAIADNGRRSAEREWRQRRDLDVGGSACLELIDLVIFPDRLSHIVQSAAAAAAQTSQADAIPFPRYSSIARDSRVLAGIKACSWPSSVMCLLSESPSNVLSFSPYREGPGVSYALNWALAATGVTPSGTVSRNLKAAKLAELSKGSAGMQSNNSHPSLHSTYPAAPEHSAVAPALFHLLPTNNILSTSSALSACAVKSASGSKVLIQGGSGDAALAPALFRRVLREVRRSNQWPGLKPQQLKLHWLFAAGMAAALQE